MYRLHSFILLFVYVCFPTNLFCLVLSSTLYAVVEKYNTNNLFCDKGHTAIQTKQTPFRYLCFPPIDQRINLSRLKTTPTFSSLTPSMSAH